MMPWLKLSISFFWIKVNQKGYFQTKTKKVNISNEFCMFKLVWGPNFTLKSFKFWDQIFPKSIFLVQNRKSPYHNWILHIRFRLGSKFQLKMTTLIFGGKFVQNWFPKKLHFCMSPWSLLTILTSFERWPTDTTTHQCLFSF